MLWRGRTRDGADWVLTLHQQDFSLRVGHQEALIPPAQAGLISVSRRLWRTTVTVEGLSDGQGDLRGLTRKEGLRLEEAVRRALCDAVATWSAKVDETIESARRDERWITEEDISALNAARPPTGRASGLPQPTEDELHSRVRTANTKLASAVLRTHRHFFDTIERSPLTDEQAHAVVAYDNRVNVIAAAGSGKTSVMVARAAYAVARGLARPEEILLLAFNKDAAVELQTRIRARFAAASLLSEGISATTFHAFGLQVIGRATGRKPTVAPWVADGDDLAVLTEIVAELREADARFALAWDLFRLLFARAVGDGSGATEPDAWDADRRRSGLRTMAGEIVRSQGERLVADWLFLNGVTYEYERPYAYDTADAEHRQYQPDFYYPDIDVWHEHWGLDAEGQPMPEWTDYASSMAWKKQLHQEHGTTLLETTWAGVMEGSDLARLREELTGHGIQLAWDPTRPAARGVRTVSDADLLRLVRSFMVHVKASSLDRHEVARRASTGRSLSGARSRMFLDLYWPVHDAWEDRLAAGGFVDFEDMLVQAAAHLEQGRYDSPHRLVMIDELQDASRARARLVRALVSRPGRHLLAVGDDWQSVNRFAGADLSVVTGFHDYFGTGPVLRLTRTFRCHQSVTDTAARFITKNPAQASKQVVAVDNRPVDEAAHEGVQLRTVKNAREVPGAIEDFLTQLHEAMRRGDIEAESVSVDVLGRYRQDANLMPRGCPADIRLAIRTIHAAKGLEADYVVVPNLSTGAYGFPSQIVDDPVLNLAMSAGDTYPHAEERRLFYVALTRARRGVLLVCPDHSPSPFVTELVGDGLVRDVGPRPIASPCPACRAGVLRPRSSRYGAFWGCSTFPKCRYTSPTPPGPAQKVVVATSPPAAATAPKDPRS